jgi:hypothetical protein
VVLSSKMESWEGVDGDGRVSLLTEASVTGRPPCGGERERAGVSERREVGDDKWGQGCQRARKKGSAGGAGRLLGRAAGPIASAGESAGAWAVLWAEPEGEKGNRHGSVFVFLFQNYK